MKSECHLRLLRKQGKHQAALKLGKLYGQSRFF